MSAFLCSDKHIATLAIAYGHLKGFDQVAIQGFADALKAENIRSVNYRYKERNRIKPCDLTKGEPIGTFNARDLWTLVGCWEYQSCERPDYLGVLAASMKEVFGPATAVWPGPKTNGIWSI